MAPCVVWVDEIEKAMSGATSGSADGGVSADKLSTLLTAMQESQKGIFWVATSNDVSRLPPELLRKGRFDDIFFVDLPTRGERRAVLCSALAAQGRGVDGLDLAEVAEATDGFTGAELTALIPEALFAAFADKARPLATADLLKAAGETNPLSRTAGDKIEALRKWAKGRTRPASTPDNSAGATVGRWLDVEGN
jgi:SpoVK/Ycf46/Vps4 family AAA+-type ATPase